VYCACWCDLDRIQDQREGVALKTDGWLWYYGTYSIAFRSSIFEFPSQKAITWLLTSRNVDITRISKGHISVLLEARITWSGIVYVYCVCWCDLDQIQGQGHAAMTVSPLSGLFFSNNTTVKLQYAVLPHNIEIVLWPQITVTLSLHPMYIHRVKWCHISVVAIIGQHVVLCVVKWWRFVALFKQNVISWFKKMSVLSISYWESDVCWRQNNKHFAELAPQNDGKQLIWRNYFTVTLCIYTVSTKKTPPKHI